MCILMYTHQPVYYEHILTLVRASSLLTEQPQLLVYRLHRVLETFH